MTDIALPLDEPRQKVHRRPPEPIVRAAELYRGGADDDYWYRWTLSRRWAPGLLVAFCGNNPSDADEKRDDPTMWRVMGFAWRWRFGGVVMVNRSPFISPSPAAVRSFENDCPVAAGVAQHENLEHVRKAFRMADVHIACWGNLATPDEIGLFLELLGPVSWQCLGTTSSGAPKHPMARGKHRVPDDAQPQPWRPRT